MKKIKELLRAIPAKAVLSLLLLVVICATIYFGAGGAGDEIVKALPYYNSHTRAQNGAVFSGKMEYAEYRYEMLPLMEIEKCDRLAVVDYETLETLRLCLTDYEKRIVSYAENGNAKDREFALKYNFDAEALREGDYCSAEITRSKNGKTIENYRIYYFDVSEKALFFFCAENAEIK